MRRTLVILELGFVALLARHGLFGHPELEAQRGLHQATERFDGDPGWDGHNNRVQVQPNPVVQDFGYGQGNHARGKMAGEIGGRVQRCTTPALYVKRLEKPRSLDHKLRCSGTLAVTQTMGTSSMYFGFCNPRTMETRPRNFMGMMINGEGRGCEVHLSYNTAAGQSDGFRATGTGPKGAKVRDFNLIPLDTPYTWDLAYDPDANNGIGAITFTLGGEGPFTAGPVVFNLTPDQRKAGAHFDAFGIINPQSAGNWLTIYFDDLSIDDESATFDDDPNWFGQGNRAQLDDYGLEGAHQFGSSDTTFAGGRRGEVGGLFYSSATTPGYYGANVGTLTLEDRLVASGKVALTEYGPDGGVYVGWFNSRKRGYPPENILGVLIDGGTSGGPCFRGCAASSDSNVAHTQQKTAPPIAPNGAAHKWKMEYDPAEDGGRGRLTVWLDDQKDSFTLSPEMRKLGATFDRFGLFVHEAGGRVVRIYFDDLEYTAVKS